MAKTGFLYRNGLGLVLIALMLASLTGQVFTGWQTENNELAEEGQNLLSMGEYLQSGHFIQAIFENWESEFLQMMLYVLLTVSLRQKGSSESKKLSGEED
jgi:cytochrome b